MADSTLDTQVQLNVTDGVATIEQGTPLTRLHYFDGKFLRADALTQEQDYHRNLVRLTNLAGGWGVVNGLGLSLAGDQLNLGPGLAITPAGSAVLLTGAAKFSVAALLKAASPAPANPAAANFAGAAFGNCDAGTPESISTSANTGFYEITAGPIEGLCGNEEVYGKLCETACVSDSQSPYWKEGLVLRLRPIALNLPTSSAVPASDSNLRNRVVSAYFAAEPWLTNSLLSSAGLNAATWCNPANLYTRDEVPLGLLVRNGASTAFIDAWSARRERMDSQARGYWQGRMAMRPWNVFIAQILQFQCQLAGLFASTGGVITPSNDCDSVRDLLEKTRAELAALHSHYSASTEKILKQFGEKPNKKDAQNIAQELKLSYAELFDIKQKLDLASNTPALPSNRLLINSGFWQLPPAGYLPVVPGTDSLPKQMQRTFGEGVQLIYRAVRHDEIAHLVEEAQHLERISLTRGLDDPKSPEVVEIFVPDGQVFDQAAVAPGIWWQVDMAFGAIGAFDLGFTTMFGTVFTSLARAQPTQILDQASDVQLATALVSAKEKPAEGPIDTARNPAVGDVTFALARDAGAAIAATPTTPPADIDEVMKKLREFFKNLKLRTLKGLARTEARSDGSLGLTLITRLDTDDIIAAIEQLLQQNPQADPQGTLANLAKMLAAITLYLAGDMTADPLQAAIGDNVSVSGEISLFKFNFKINGTLTPLFDRPTSGGETERVLQLSLVLADGKGNVVQAQSNITLLKTGSPGNGELVLDDAQHDAKTSPNFFTYSSNPRRATLSVLGASKESVPFNLMRAAANMVNDSNNTANIAGTEDNEADLERKTLATLYGLNGMPAPSSAIGAAALNNLIQLADASGDAAFLARARKRLFPSLDLPSSTGVKAVLDWVMFRRARTVLCCPPKATQASGLEAFQAWHLKLADEAAVKKLLADLDSKDPAALAKYPFARVGVLRYRDANTVAEESPASVLALWQAAKPAAQVVLGRYWEQSPSVGQGWQNHFRLTSMLEQIASITAAPERGTGAISRLEPVFAPLSDAGLDGGFLVVTLQSANLRNALLIYTRWDRPNHLLDVDDPREDLSFAGSKPQGTVLASFIGKLTPNEPVLGVTLATTKGAPDSDGGARLAAVVDALVSAGRPKPVASRQTLEALNDHDRRQLIGIGVDVDKYDDIVFLEINSEA